MPIITRSHFNASTPSSTASRSSTRRPSNSSLVPADATKFHGFLEASYRSWRPTDTPHSFAMRNLNAGLIAAGGIPSTKVVYDALAEYAISQNSQEQRLSQSVQTAWTRFKSSDLKGRALQESLDTWARSEAYYLKSEQTPFLRAYYALIRYANEQIGQQRQATTQAPVTVQKAVPRRRERNVNQLLWAQWVNWFEAFYEEAKEARDHDWSNYAIEHWSRFVRREYNLSQTEVSEWLEAQDADRLLDSVGM